MLKRKRRPKALMSRQWQPVSQKRRWLEFAVGVTLFFGLSWVISLFVGADGTSSILGN